MHVPPTTKKSFLRRPMQVTQILLANKYFAFPAYLTKIITRHGVIPFEKLSKHTQYSTHRQCLYKVTPPTDYFSFAELQSQIKIFQWGFFSTHM